MITRHELTYEYLSDVKISQLDDSGLLSAFELAVIHHDDMELSDDQTNRIVTNMGNLRTHVLARMAKPAG